MVVKFVVLEIRALVRKAHKSHLAQPTTLVADK